MSDYIYITKPGAHVKVKVEFPHTLIPSEPAYFNVVAELACGMGQAFSGTCKLLSLSFVGNKGTMTGKELFLSVSGKELTNILSLIDAKLDSQEYTRI